MASAASPRTAHDPLGDPPLEAVTAALHERGVARSFTDAFGEPREAPERTVRQLAARFLLGTDAPAPLVCTPGRHHPGLHGLLTLECGEQVRVDGVCHVDGYHHLVGDDGVRRLVLAAPERLPEPRRSYGWNVQLYAARSRDSWGIGDYRDLGAISRRARRDGAGAILVSPIHAMTPTSPQQNSPYSPSSRLWLNLQHVAPGAAPGAERVDLSDLAARGRALNAARRIDRDAAWALKLAALERIWSAVRDDLPGEHAAFVAEGGDELRRFATFSALAAALGPNWHEWPARYRAPDGQAVLAFAEEHADRVAFWGWCQWVADRQLEDAAHAGCDLILDLAVGFDASGCDAWAYQDTLAFDFEVGCPPDGHNLEGQRWGLPPFDPAALLRCDFAPIVHMVRRGLRHAAALRLDHVMQLWRLFWVPSPGSAQDGAYVHYPVDALLAILRIEACRAGAWIVGEDMGTVAPCVRETMQAIGMLGYRVAVRSDPAGNPECTVGACATHDQTTIAGYLTGQDARDLTSIGKLFNAEEAEDARLELCRLGGLDPAAPVGPADIARAVVAKHALLAASPSRIVLATLDDACAVTERPNMPGTIDQWPNWRIALPVPVDELFDRELPRRLQATLAGNGRDLRR